MSNPIKPLRISVSQLEVAPRKEISDNEGCCSIVMIDCEAEKTSSTGAGIPWVPEGFFRSEAAIVSDEATIEIISRQDLDRGFATKKNPSGTQRSAGNTIIIKLGLNQKYNHVHGSYLFSGLFQDSVIFQGLLDSLPRSQC